uniref:Uncharacterized protein n=1 Tax=Glossina brevipalpis TaxID=37001 RepID=A0A1A9WUW4_9MUSC
MNHRYLIIQILSIFAGTITSFAVLLPSTSWISGIIDRCVVNRLEAWKHFRTIHKPYVNQTVTRHFLSKLCSSKNSDVARPQSAWPYSCRHLTNSQARLLHHLSNLYNSKTKLTRFDLFIQYELSLLALKTFTKNDKKKPEGEKNRDLEIDMLERFSKLLNICTDEKRNV